MTGVWAGDERARKQLWDRGQCQRIQTFPALSVKGDEQREEYISGTKGACTPNASIPYFRNLPQ